MACYGVVSHFTDDGLKLGQSQDSAATIHHLQGLGAVAREEPSYQAGPGTPLPAAGDVGMPVKSQPAKAQLGPPPKRSPSPDHWGRHCVN